MDRERQIVRDALIAKAGGLEKLEFVIKVLPYTGSDEWIVGTLQEIFETLESDKIPPPNPDRDFCSYTEQAAGVSRD